jgi:uncharacterized protein YjiS (DUF1127 family)
MLTTATINAAQLAGRETAMDKRENRSDKQVLDGARSTLLAFQEILREWRRRSRSRRELSQFTHAELQDIGLSSADARWETKKLFWQS